VEEERNGGRNGGKKKKGEMKEGKIGSNKQPTCRRVVRREANVSEDHTASIFRVEE
jgi:hypothetical protein